MYPNVCFKKTGTKQSSNTQLHFVPVFLKQTLLYIMRYDGKPGEKLKIPICAKNILNSNSLQNFIPHILKMAYEVGIGIFCSLSR